MVELSNLEFNLLQGYLRNISGIDVPEEKRYLFQTRLSEFLEEENCRSFSELYCLLTKGERGLQRRLIQAMTNHESCFFRDGPPFENLVRRLLPEAAARRNGQSQVPFPIRILSAGCASGQEPYSIAMCVRDWLEGQPGLRADQVVIHAIDVSQRILARAAQGRYTDQEVGKFINDRQRKRYFVRKGDHWEVCEQIRRCIGFSEMNLSEPFGYIGKFDVIFCRNVIIYFNLEQRQKIVNSFLGLLHRGGALVLGASESLYAVSNAFTAVHDGPTMYYVPTAGEPAGSG